MLLPLLALAASAVAADTTRWIVSNHGREAGDLVVVRTADSAIVRWVFTDRNRGTRVEMRYQLNDRGDLVRGEQRPVLMDGAAGAPTDGFEAGGDSVWYGLGNGMPRTALRRPAAAYVTVRAGTPWEQAKLARYLLAQPARTAAPERKSEGLGHSRASLPRSLSTACRPMSRRQKPSGQRMRSMAV